MLKGSYEVFTYPGAFSPKECRTIIKAFDLPQRLSKSSVSSGTDRAKQQVLNAAIRKTLSTTVSKNETEFLWIRNRILKYSKQANETYKTRITDDLTDDLQFLKYGPGGHYIRHRDVGPGLHARRELSVIVQLSSAKDYRGGEVMMENSSKDMEPAPKDQGTIIVFRSHLDHQVMPVTKGMRYSMVAWVARPPNLLEKIKGALSRSAPSTA